MQQQIYVGVFVWAHSILISPDGKNLLSIDKLFLAISRYWCSIYYHQLNLSVINQPDSLGLACDFQPFSFYLVVQNLLASPTIPITSSAHGWARLVIR
ncbi:MAG: hypothetical protein IPP46_08645 [Bacteroidetes bacterium]|nr:hypothetical protein [Bacteroidota bacterium]